MVYKETKLVEFESYDDAILFATRHTAPYERASNGSLYVAEDFIFTIRMPTSCSYSDEIVVARYVEGKGWTAKDELIRKWTEEKTPSQWVLDRTFRDIRKNKMDGFRITSIHVVKNTAKRGWDEYNSRV